MLKSFQLHGGFTLLPPGALPLDPVIGLSSPCPLAPSPPWKNSYGCQYVTQMWLYWMGSMWIKLSSNVQQIMMYRNTTEFALWSIDQWTYYYNYGNITQYLLINITNSQIKHHRLASLNLIITGGLPGTAFTETPIFQCRMTRIMRTSIESIFNCRQPNGESSVKEHYTCPMFKSQYSTF